VATSLAAGSYCDLLTGGRTGSACAGTIVIVDASGAIQLRLASNSALVLDGAAKL